MKILLTVFAPFGGETTNPALEAIKQIPDRLGELEITKLAVPTIFGKSLEVVKAEPYIPSQAAAKGVVPASMALEDIVKGLQAGILAFL